MKRLALLTLFLSGAAYSQTTTNPQVWSATTASCENQSAYSCATAAWRNASPQPLLVATGRTTTCRWGSTPIVWLRPTQLQSSWCVAARRSATEDTFLAASVLWPSQSTDCSVSPWSDWVPEAWGNCTAGVRSRTETRTRTIVTQPANGGAACPALTESRTVSEACELPPPPRTSVVISVTSQRVYTNEAVTVSWVSQNATSCTASWTQDPVPFSGSASITMVQPMAFARVSVRCIGAANEYEAGTGWVVLSRAPDCYAKTPDDRDKVNVKALSLSNVSLRYQIMAVWWCGSPTGPIQQRFVLGVQDQETIAAFRKWLDRQFDEAGVRSRCEQNCEVLPPGALKDELDSWAALPENSAAALGVIQP